MRVKVEQLAREREAQGLGAPEDDSGTKSHQSRTLLATIMV